MSSVSYSSSKRAGTAYAAAKAARARRQKIFVGILCLGLVGLVVWEAPIILKAIRGTKATPVVAVPPVAGPTTPDAQQKLRAVRRSTPSDPFGASPGSLRDTGARDVPTPPGSRDPFAAPSASSGSTAVATATATPLPEQIVIGTPGAGRHASHGWIVILASIPTNRGKASAASFAASARDSGVSPVAVLNSSNRKPLRGGYWVVYTGPLKTLGEVTSRANSVHSHGYATAYIRELIVYR